jgi:hypothetical protein
MRTTSSSLLLLTVLLGCSDQPVPPRLAEPTADTYLNYRSIDGSGFQSTLRERRAPDGHSLHGHTQLADGTWLMEEATLDAKGHLLHAAFERGSLCSDDSAHMVLDPRHGEVEISTLERYTRWAVPTDYAWLATGVLEDSTTGASVATPLTMTLALRGTAGRAAVRVVDLTRHTSATVMPDQLRVENAKGGPTVVLGDDYAETDGDLARRVHLAALATTLDNRTPQGALALAQVSCRKLAHDTDDDHDGASGPHGLNQDGHDSPNSLETKAL